MLETQRKEQQMSITDYLETLSFDQLCFARQKASDLIEAKKNEAKVTIWAVSDRDLVAGYFKNYIDAVECFYAEAVRRLNNPKVHDDERCLQITRMRVSESELAGYLEHGSNARANGQPPEATG